ncbi:uncharacterized protein LOC143258559 isoform X2 [Tachypleus tridentatus]|uniref:uncharacterized protein LOC143258559 isoform X2 n=1 Tax=Tachypleus tridentatus TaxID=6853 RepID=UPI003FD316DD
MSTNKEVKLTCIARGSRPPATITWWKGSQQISPSGVRVTTEGDTTTSSLLFTPSVEDNGKHVSCKAENLRIPDSEIQKGLSLEVHYSPVCQPAQKFVYGILKPESVQIQCHLDADPKEVKFFWRFNSSTKVTDQIIHSVESALKSIASHNIESDEGFGTLLCWGENEIGTQKDPCVFNIIPAEAPLPVENCTVFNRTEDMILVECLEGFNGGMDQTFIMEVYSEESTTLYAKVSSQVPIFLVNGLTQGTVFMLFIYAVNRKGRSSVIQLSTSTIRQAAKLTRERSGTFVFNPVLTVFVSTTVALISVIFILIVVVKIRKRAMLKAPQQRKSSRDNSHRSEAPCRNPWKMLMMVQILYQPKP